LFPSPPKGEGLGMRRKGQLIYPMLTPCPQAFCWPFTNNKFENDYDGKWGGK
jgi:hypothetical protein